MDRTDAEYASRAWDGDGGLMDIELFNALGRLKSCLDFAYNAVDRSNFKFVNEEKLAQELNEKCKDVTNRLNQLYKV